MMSIRTYILAELDAAVAEIDHFPRIARAKLEHLTAVLNAWPDVQVLGKPAIVDDPDNWNADIYPLAAAD